MDAFYDLIVLSPHLDDAALSCGGYIYTLTQQGKRVLVFTLMAGDPPNRPFSDFAKQMHAQWELAFQVVAQRKAEDVVACGILGADYVHGTIPDAIYRYDPKDDAYFYTSDEALFGAVDPIDEALTVPLIAGMLEQLPSYDQLLVPLTVGNHVDHQLVRTAVEKSPIAPISYYEDYPYAGKVGAVETVIANDRFALEYESIIQSEDSLQARIQAIEAFKSQLSTLFTTHQEVQAKVNAYVSRIGGERIWHQQSA